MRRLVWAGALGVAVTAAGATVPASPASSQAPSLNGSAYGAFVKVGLFGGQPNQVGAAPAVILPESGERQTGTRPSIIGQFGPATILGGQYEDPGRNPTGPLTVSTEGTTSPERSVTSTASVVNIGPGPLIADKMTSTCTAGPSGVTGSATIDGGIVETKYDVNTQDPIAKVDIDRAPPPNTAVEGMLDHIGDRYRIVFNEQILKGDTIVVRAAHMYLLGDIAVGDLIIGQSVCGLSPDDGSTAPPPEVPSQFGASTSLPAARPETATTVAAAAATEEDDGGGSTGIMVGAAAIGVLMLLGIGLRLRKKRPAVQAVSEPDSSEG